MDFDAKLQGFNELANGLAALGPKLGKNVLRRAVSAGSSIVRVEAKQNALRIKKTGTLARAIYQKQIRELSSPWAQTFYVGVRSGKIYAKVGKKGLSQDAFYGKWVELGHFTRAAGGVARRSAPLLREVNRGGKNNSALAAQVQSGHVRWVSARPFLRPAFDLKKGNAVDAMGAEIGLSLMTEAQKIKIATGK